MPKKEDSNQQKTLRKNQQKWTKVLMEPGWVVLPTIILQRQQAFKLDPVDVNILLQLAQYWWFKDQLPHPSKKTIAECIGRSPSTVQRHIANMEKKGLIKRNERFNSNTRGQTSNEYSFDGLIETATPYAKKAIVEKKAREKERQKARTRQSP